MPFFSLVFNFRFFWKIQRPTPNTFIKSQRDIINFEETNTNNSAANKGGIVISSTGGADTSSTSINIGKNQCKPIFSCVPRVGLGAHMEYPPWWRVRNVQRRWQTYKQGRGGISQCRRSSDVCKHEVHKCTPIGDPNILSINKSRNIWCRSYRLMKINPV